MKRKKLLSIILTLIMIVSLCSNVSVTEAATKKQKTSLSSKAITLKEGQKKTVKLKNYKKLSKKAIKKVKWSTTNKKVVTVKYSGKYRQDGKLNAKKEGTAYVKVKYNGKTYKCKVIVKAKEEPTTEAKTTEKVTTEAKTTEKATTEKSTEKATTEENTEKPTHVHEWSEWSVSKEATCVKDGTEERKCSSCDKVEQRVIKASGHEYKKFTQNATCEEDGIITKTCINCEHTETEAIKATGHKWNNGIVIQEATYTAPGVKEYTCTVCGKTKEDSIPMLNETEHSWNEGIITTQPTCTSVGEKTYTCKNCGGAKTEVILAKGHNYDEGHVTKEPTCKENGVKTYTCQNCSNIKTESISNEGISHTWNTLVIIEQATCAKEGSQSKTCKVCGENVLEVILKTEDHRWNTHVTTKEPTCGETGIETYTCSVCKSTKTEVIAKTTDHEYDEGKITLEPTCSKNGVKTYTCTICGDIKTEAVSATGEHTYNGGVVTTEPTCCTKGVKTYTCVDCGNTKTESIETTGKHSYINTVVEKSNYNTNGYSHEVCSVCGNRNYNSDNIYFPISNDTPEFVKEKENEMNTTNYVSVASNEYLYCIKGQSSTMRFRAWSNKERSERVYRDVLVMYSLDNTVKFEIYEEFNSSATPIKSVRYSLSELEELLGSSIFDGLYYGDTIKSKGLTRAESSDCLNSHDMYLSSDDLYLTPQALWGVLWANGEKGYSEDIYGYGGYLITDPNFMYKIKEDD